MPTNPPQPPTKPVQATVTTPATQAQTPRTPEKPLTPEQKKAKEEADKKKAEEEKKKQEEAAKKAPPKRPEFRRPANRGPATLKTQNIDPKVQPTAKPLSITFLTGAFKGKRMEIGQWLGVAIDEISHESGAEWTAKEAKRIRPNSEFQKLADRKFSFKLTFFDLNEDISQLTENLEHLIEVSDEDGSNPLLSLRQGKFLATPVVCLSKKVDYKMAHVADGGYQYAEVTLDFLLLAGTASEHALGGPLSPTPLEDIRATQTREERERKGLAAVAQELLAPCLGEQGNKQLQQLLKDNKLNDVEALKKLDAAALSQLAVSGMIPKEALSNKELQEKLKKDLAFIIAQNEAGVGTTFDRKFANAILETAGTSALSQLPARLQAEVESTRNDFNKISEAVLSGELGDSSAVFNRSAANPTAGERLRRSFSCGLNMRRIQANSIKAADPEKDKITLGTLKDDLERANKGEITDEEIKKMFGLKTESQVRALKNGAPYTSRQDFIDRSSKMGIGLTGLVLWSNYMDYKAKPPEPVTPPATPPAP